MFRLQNNEALISSSNNIFSPQNIKPNDSKKNLISDNIKYPMLNSVNKKVKRIRKYLSNSQPKLFSLIDIDEKKTNSKGLSIPNIYKKYDENELKTIFLRKIKNKNQKIKLESEKKSNKTYLNKTQIIPNQNEIIEKYKIKKVKKNKNQEKKITEINTKKYLETIASRKMRLYKPKIWDNLDETINLQQRDLFMPKGFELYEKIIKKAAYNNIKNLSIEEKNLNSGKTKYIPIRHKIKKNMSESDIFHQKKNKDYDKLINNHKRDFQNSDIFNIKNNIENINKSGEKSFFKKYDNNLKYTTSRESKSEWKPKSLKPNLLNYSSINYNILNPNTHNVSKTKEEIKKECEKINNIENYTHKQKSLCEFIDLSRVFAPNCNNDFIDILKKNPKACYKKNNICSEYYDIHGHYKNLCDKPFSKPKFFGGEL